MCAMMKNIFIELQNRYPNDTDHGAIFKEFTNWLTDEDNPAGGVFVPDKKKIGVYLDLCNSKRVTTDEILSYWCDHIKDNIHNGEGFVIKSK